MAIIASAANTDREPCPTGNHLAVCAFVEDLGMEWSDKYQKPDHKVAICWELAAKMQDGRPFMVSRRYTLSLGEKSNLRGDLESWRGRKFTAEELKGFDLEKLIGINCLLNVIEEDRNGKLARVIASVSPPMAGMPKLVRYNTAPPDWVAQARTTNAAKMAQHKATAAPFPQNHMQPVPPTTYAQPPVSAAAPFVPPSFAPAPPAAPAPYVDPNEPPF